MMISKAHTCSFKSIDQTRRATIMERRFHRRIANPLYGGEFCQ